MPLINPPNVSTPTLVQQIAKAVGLMQTGYANVQNNFNYVANLVWHNPNYTPQQVFDAFGTNAAQLVQLSALLKPVIALVTGSTPVIPPAGYSLTINNDGTVTVNQTSSSSSSSSSSSGS